MSEQLKSSIVRIHDQHGGVVGVGFLVTNREILTCAHVVAQALGIREDTPEEPVEKIQLDFPLVAPGEMLTAQIVRWHPVGSSPEAEEDIAVLELECDASAEAQAVGLITSKKVWGHPFRALGFPVGYDQGVWASGRLLDCVTKGWVQVEDVKETGFRVQPGFSGGPVWDDEVDGVVGMIVAADQRPEIKAAFVIPVSTLIKVWPALGKPDEPETGELIITGSRYAVLINPRYESEDQNLKPLKWTSSDVTDLKRTLEDTNIGGFQEVKHLSDSLDDIFEDTIKVFKQANQGDLVLLYFSGHVVIDSDHEWYFLDSEANLSRPSIRSVSLEQIKKFCIIGRKPEHKVDHIVIILDCLYHTEDDETPVNKEMVQKVLEKLSDVPEGKQIAIISSVATAGEEKDDCTHGLLSQYLIKGMKTGEADFSGDKRTTLSELYNYICYAPHIEKRAENYPKPLKWELHSKGDIIIASTSNKSPERRKYRYIAELLKEGKVIPFLGTNAVLPVFQKVLSEKMAELIEPDPEFSSLPLCSQYFEWRMSREDLYDKVKKALLEELDLKPVKIHRLLAMVDKPLIVMTTLYDSLLEEVFQAHDKKYILITQLINSQREDYRGKVVVKYFHGKEKGETKAEILSSKRSKIEYLDSYSLIYKIQGSLELPSHDVDEKDSLIISEEDYLSFLEWFSIPEPLNHPLQTKMLLFLGCSMRDWSFRVLIHAILRNIEPTRKTHVVRKPDDANEEIYWSRYREEKRKGIEFIEKDLSEFIIELAEDMDINL